MTGLRLAIVALAMWVTCGSAFASDFNTVAVVSGVAGVRDGDDILFGDVPVRLQGIAAPEDRPRKKEPGGPEATAHLRELAEGKFVVCHLDGTEAPPGSNRAVGICYVGAVELNERQVRAGFARDCFAFSRGRYAEAEEAARREGNDLSASYPLPSYCE